MFYTNEQTIHDVLESLNMDIRLMASDITVKLENGKIILTGIVPTLHARSVAEEDAYQVPEVMFVENLLKVRA